ncbi:MAG: hypothetical protein DLM56_10035 [Pseudonocardiales bacterium]|nr:MAG: hypothetical protein DLM56_10035 [Pseudonocardiales bacterium]
MADTAALPFATMERRPASVRELITLGSTLVGCMVVGVVAGLLVDRALHSSPLYTVVGTAVGIVSACVSLYVRIRRFINFPKR